MSLYIALACIVFIAAMVVIAYVALSKWFDARYPAAAAEIARADVENLLSRVNQEFTNRPRLSVPTSI